MVDEVLILRIGKEYAKGNSIETIQTSNPKLKKNEICSLIAEYYIGKGKLNQRKNSLVKHQVEPKLIEDLFFEYKEEDKFDYRKFGFLYGINIEIIVQIIKKLIKKEEIEKQSMITTERKIPQIINLFEKGMGYFEISDVLKTSPEQIKKLIDKYYKENGKEKPRTSLVETNELIKYLEQGWNINNLRKKFLTEDNIIISNIQFEIAKEFISKKQEEIR